MQPLQIALIDHVHMRVADLEASRRFYRAALAALGRSFSSESKTHFACEELWVDKANTHVSRLHLAFRATDMASVVRFHSIALEAGGKDNGGPGFRHYHQGYFAAFVFDPDGNNIEAVFHGTAADMPL
jgi:catechol 2,3-dioxygenase-like lactoylglutathione lyase family enzyme